MGNECKGIRACRLGKYEHKMEERESELEKRKRVLEIQSVYWKNKDSGAIKNGKKAMAAGARQTGEKPDGYRALHLFSRSNRYSLWSVSALSHWRVQFIKAITLCL